MSVRILPGDVRAVLAALPGDYFDVCVTSPPYWGLRSYLTADHPDKPLEIGLEPTLGEHLTVLVQVFREVRRVLKPSGVCWVNYGDCYANDGKWGGETGGKQAYLDDASRMRCGREKRFTGLKPKDLCMLANRLAIALQDDGWWVRSEVIWSKPNPMPSSVTDRPATAHEKVWMLTKAPRYYWDLQASKEERSSEEDANTFRGGCYVNGDTDNARLGKRKVRGNRKLKVPGGWEVDPGAHGTINHKGLTSATYVEDKQRATAARTSASNGHQMAGFNDRWDASENNGTAPSLRNMRNVWEIATSPFAEAHFATFPPALVERCLMPSAPARGCCAACGKPLVRIVEDGEPDHEHRRACGADASGGYNGAATKDYAAAGAQDASATKARILAGMVEKITVGWRASCKCTTTDTVPARVLDPFGGAGTVGLVADRAGFDATLIELNPASIDIADRRIRDDAGMFAEVSA